jgi:hypothetical protein
VFYSLDSLSGQATAIAAFFNSLKGYFPNPLTWSFPSSGDVIDSNTGLLSGGWTDSAVADVAATGSGFHAAGIGARVVWSTGSIVGHRRLKGSTFLCPVIVGVYETNGTLDTTFRSAISTAGTTLWTTGLLNVWHRPPAGTHSGGEAHVVTGVEVPDRVTALRSRRY